jgi:hypothetical protein
LSTTNPTWLNPGSNPGRRGGKPTTNRLALLWRYFCINQRSGSAHQCPDTQSWAHHELGGVAASVGVRCMMNCE